MTRICIFGAGAIGGYLGARLSMGGAKVSLIARGNHLAAIQESGLRLLEKGQETVTHPHATDNPGELGPQDYVIVAVKAHSLSEATTQIQPLVGPETAIVYALNGVPWWYFYRLEGPFKDRQIETVDPGGKIWQSLDPERAIGCVVYLASEVTEPGTIRFVEGDRISLGEPSGKPRQRTRDLSNIFKRAGLRAPVRANIRNELWVKLWGNCSFNPMSVLTGATLEEMCLDDGVRETLRKIMCEVQMLAEKIGVVFPIDVDQRILGAQAIGAHKTSMLQDFERQRPLETGPLVEAVQELGQMTGTLTPALDDMLATLKLKIRIAAQ